MPILIFSSCAENSTSEKVEVEVTESDEWADIMTLHDEADSAEDLDNYVSELWEYNKKMIEEANNGKDFESIVKEEEERIEELESMAPAITTYELDCDHINSFIHNNNTTPEIDTEIQLLWSRNFDSNIEINNLIHSDDSGYLFIASGHRIFNFWDFLTKFDNRGGCANQGLFPHSDEYNDTTGMYGDTYFRVDDYIARMYTRTEMIDDFYSNSIPTIEIKNLKDTSIDITQELTEYGTPFCMSSECLGILSYSTIYWYDLLNGELLWSKYIENDDNDGLFIKSFCYNSDSLFLDIVQPDFDLLESCNFVLPVNIDSSKLSFMPKPFFETMKCNVLKVSPSKELHLFNHGNSILIDETNDNLLWNRDDMVITDTSTIAATSDHIIWTNGAELIFTNIQTGKDYKKITYNSEGKLAPEKARINMWLGYSQSESNLYSSLGRNIWFTDDKIFLFIHNTLYCFGKPETDTFYINPVNIRFDIVEYDCDGMTGEHIVYATDASVKIINTKSEKLDISVIQKPSYIAVDSTSFTVEPNGEYSLVVEEIRNEPERSASGDYSTESNNQNSLILNISGEVIELPLFLETPPHCGEI
ncbi:MAG TPA: hypothetical protein PLP35_01935 [Caldisericia bacterium]|nr:hypothetical protein [Caldisericia bacterium]